MDLWSEGREMLAAATSDTVALSENAVKCIESIKYTEVKMTVKTLRWIVSG